MTSGKTLRKRLLLAVPERDRHQKAHDDFNRTLPNPSYQERWTAMVVAWEKDKTKPNPYFTEKTGMSPFDRGLLSAKMKLVPTEAEVRFRLQEDERRAIADGNVKIHETSATSLLAAGLALEESQ